jgi:hypothetical protein
MTTDFIGKNVLCTTQSWFVAPDGKQYRAIWGKLKAIHEAGKTLGFIPNRAHANWFYEIGETIIMGCEVLFVILSEEKPNTEKVTELSSTDGKEYERPTMIYLSK